MIYFIIIMTLFNNKLTFKNKTPNLNVKLKT